MEYLNSNSNVTDGNNEVILNDINVEAKISDFIMDDSIDETSLVSEIIRTVESDARVEPYSVKVNILKNETGKIEAEITYQLIGYDTDINEVISIDRNIWSSNNEI